MGKSILSGYVSALVRSQEDLEQEQYAIVNPSWLFYKVSLSTAAQALSSLWILGEAAPEPQGQPCNEGQAAGSKAPETRGVNAHSWDRNPRGLWWKERCAQLGNTEL